ncbi:hypothetical protein AB1Y20_009907 [Prymnesium parvum]|uniref:Fibronectin type-III domain-containing protein n=1 Tax=Prymnesium parvum TaxID=97485 RepID=A0AB34K6F0_PRYPA
MGTESGGLDAMEDFILKMKPEPPEAPRLESAGAGDIRVRWTNPTGQAAFREVSVLMRPSGESYHHTSSSEWGRVDSRTKTLMLDGWKTFPSEPPEVVVIGLDPDTPYEAMLEVLTVRGFQLQSPVSDALQVGKANQPAAPLLEAVASSSIRVRWVLPEAEPPIERVLIFMRQVGDADWCLVDNHSKTLVDAGFSGCQLCAPAPSEITVSGLHADRAYECKVACLNEYGWSEHSQTSAVVHLGS